MENQKRTEQEDIIYFLRELGWGKSDDFKNALRELIIRIRKLEK